VLEAGLTRTLAFGLTWWSLIFPMGERLGSHFQSKSG
jgi:hypothetical protein